MHFSPLFPVFLSFPLSLFLIVHSAAVLPSTVQYRSIFFLVRDRHHLPFSRLLVYRSLLPPLPFLRSISLSVSRWKGNRGNKAIRLWCSAQPRLSISIYPMQSLPTGNCVQVCQAFQQCGGWNSDWIFPKCRMCQWRVCQWARDAGEHTRKRDTGKWLIMYRVSATFSECDRAYRKALHRSSFCSTPEDAFTSRGFRNSVVKSIRTIARLLIVKHYDAN